MMPLEALNPYPSALAFTPVLVRERMVEAYEIEFRTSGDRIIRSAWSIPTIHTFADLVGWTADEASERVQAAWSRATASPREISQSEQTIGWLRFILDRRDEHFALSEWAKLRAAHLPLEILMRRRGWSRTGLHRLVVSGSARIAHVLNQK